MQWWLIPFLTFALPAQALTLVTENYPPNNYSTDDGKTIIGQATDVLREAIARAGMSAVSSSNTMARAFRARSLAVFTTMFPVGWRVQEAESVRSPSISTTQARQLPSLR